MFGRLRKKLHTLSRNYAEKPSLISGVVKANKNEPNSIASKLLLDKKLKKAVAAKDFHILLQPIHNLETRKVIGFESLIRWYDSKGNQHISQRDFLEKAEKNSIIREIDEWIIGCACSLLKKFTELLPTAKTPFFITVNISSTHLYDQRIVQIIAEAIKNTGIDPSSLWIEINESAIIIDHLAAQACLLKLKGLGVKIVMDDFGTGYSSLSNLQNLPIDIIKIDGRFISGIIHHPKSMDITRAIMSLADIFGLEVLAEGIENKEEADWLRTLGCKSGQGYFFRHPGEFDAILTYTKDNLGIDF